MPECPASYQTNILLLCMTALCSNASAFQQTPDSPKEYGFTIAARSGQQGFLSFSDAPSINDKGNIAFVGRITAGDGVFLYRRPDVINLTTGFQGTNRSFGRAVQLNNKDVAIARDQVSGSPPRSLIRFWQADRTPITAVTLVRGGDTNAPFDAVLSHPTLNNVRAIESRAAAGGNDDGKCDPGETCIEQAAFTALQDATTVLASVTKTPLDLVDRGTFATYAMGSSPIRAVLADNGRIITRDTIQGNQQIMLLNYGDFRAPIPIATLGMGFTTLGQSPGISDDGSLAAFYGDLTPAGATALKSTSGPGIFAWLDRVCVSAGPDGILNSPALNDDIVAATGIRSGPDGVCNSVKAGDDRQRVPQNANSGALLRLAGVAGNKQLDAGETCEDTNGDGVCQANEPDIGTVGGFDADVRVSVSNNGSVVWVGYDRQGRRTIFTTLIDFFKSTADIAASVASPSRAVISEGQTIAGFGTVKSLGVHDSINNQDRGTVAFWATNEAGEQAVISAAPVCPEGTYAAPATNSYIHQYDAGVYLSLPIGLNAAGGNSCGPASTAMAYNAVQFANGRTARANIYTPNETPARSVYNRTMKPDPNSSTGGMNYTTDNGQAYLNDVLGVTSRLFAPARTTGPDTVADMYHFLDDSLDQGEQVIISTTFTSRRRAQDVHGAGHIILVTGRTAAGDYIVKDPAGNFFAGSPTELEHYGLGVSCGGNAVYPRDALRNRLARRNGDALVPATSAPVTLDTAVPREALAVPGILAAPPNLPKAKAARLGGATSLVLRARSDDNSQRPYLVWIEDAQGRRAGFPAEGVAVADIPGSETRLLPDLPTDPDSEPGAEVTNAALFGIYIRNPSSGLKITIQGIRDAAYAIDVSESTADGALQAIKAGAITAGETKTIPASTTPQLLADADGDADVDSDDVRAIAAARGQVAVPGDPRDVDGNGTIDALDARAAVPLCTRPRCAVQ